MLRRLQCLLIVGWVGLGCSGQLDDFDNDSEPDHPIDHSDWGQVVVDDPRNLSDSTGPEGTGGTGGTGGSGGVGGTSGSGGVGGTSGGTGGSSGGGMPDPVEAAIARARSGVGFSYKWGGSCWDPGGDHRGACYGVCPGCSHVGTWGADCAGYVSKIWQVPHAEKLTNCAYSLSTWNFRFTKRGWYPIRRAGLQRGDALVHHNGAEGHIFLFQKGDGWGWVSAFEAKGCSYGIRHDLRKANGTYIAIRRRGYN